MKQTLREQLLKKRRSLEAGAHAQMSRDICRHGLTAIIDLMPTTVGAYAPMQGEADIWPLLAELYCQGMTVALPVVMPNSKRLDYRRYIPGDQLQPGTHGTRVPSASAPRVTPDCLLVPLLGIDAQGHRLGYGGGYFDATLQSLRASNPDLAVCGVAFTLQMLTTPLPREAHDEAVDMLITENGVDYFPRGENQ